MGRETKAEMKARLEAETERLTRELSELRESLASSAAHSVAGGRGTPKGSPAAVTRPAVYVRVKRTIKWDEQRLGVGMVIKEPALDLLRDTHGHWEWCPEATWHATARKYHCEDGTLKRWQGPGQ